ncbi:aminoacyl-histidine dipeptidase [Peptoniphilus obesi]|uniref:aminoacyl-histidine dipeptidase n=1 Tax=Peptoniphilus obesi TaxID=1472765 RepID=UPI0004B992CE|nr:aminoacyl-histidine dipeptidase [Peptoniphilus obesi]
MGKLENLEPKRVFYYFEEITKIPRCSFKEEKIKDFLINFAKDHGFEYYDDKYNNVIIKKEASPGYEDKEAIILQGHTDMVCEKLDGSDFNFDTDPIKFTVEDNKIIAKETTLGADNGIAVAMILAILESDEYKHPKIEALFTATEETGMVGAKNLDGSKLEAKTLINLDSESEGVACVSCACGQRENIIFDKKYIDIKEERQFYQLIISGLKGGHSGQEINKGLANANKLLARSLDSLFNKFDILLIDIYGGSKENAIPRSSRAIIGVLDSDIRKIQDEIVSLNRDFVKEYGNIDPDVRLNFEKSDACDKALNKNLSNNLIKALNIIPNGVDRMSDNIEGLVGASSNIGIIESTEDQIIIHNSLRAELESLKDDIARRNRIIAELCQAGYKISNNYPAWEYKNNSRIRDLSIDVYRELTRSQLKIESIHAGLECAILADVIGDIDMISFGPSMHNVHSPGENLEIESVANVFNFLINLIEEIKY